jgi:hypothetical protein
MINYAAKVGKNQCQIEKNRVGIMPIETGRQRHFGGLQGCPLKKAHNLQQLP